MAHDHGPLATTMRTYGARRSRSPPTNPRPPRPRWATTSTSSRSARSQGRALVLAGLQVPRVREEPAAGNGLWRERFKYKNAGRPGERGEGYYFDVPIAITDPVVSAWLRDKPPGMALMPDEFIAGVEALASDPVNGAKRFA